MSSSVFQTLLSYCVKDSIPLVRDHSEDIHQDMENFPGNIHCDPEVVHVQINSLCLLVCFCTVVCKHVFLSYCAFMCFVA